MRLRLATPTTALVLGVSMLLLAVASVPLGWLAHQLSPGGSSGQVLLLAPFAAVGFVVARRQPRNPIGWLLLALAVLMMLSIDAGMYAVLAYRLGHHGLPLARLAVFLTQTWIALVVLLPLPIVLFPDGRLPSPRWRWTLWCYIALGAVFVGTVGATDVHAFTDPRIRVDSSGELVRSGQGGGAGGAVAVALFALIVLSWAIAKLLEYRRSTGERRQQLKWLVTGGTVSVVALVVTLTAGGSFLFLGIAALPLSLGVGILKYRLYEIDRLISRTISYTVVTGVLVAVFVGLVVLTTDVLPFSSPVGVAASTLAAAALFNPLRVRVQRLVDRRFNRARYDAEATVAAFAQRLRDAVDPESVEEGLVDAVRRAVEPAHLSVWLRGTA